MMAQKWQIKIADDLNRSDNEKACEFLNSFRSTTNDLCWSPEYFEWKLKDNPAGKGFLTLAVSGDRVVGTVSATPKRIWYEGKMVRGAETGDTYTAADFQRQGIFSTVVDANRKRAQEAGDILIYGTPNEQSRPGYEKKLEFLTHTQFTMITPVYLCKLPALIRNRLPSTISQLISNLLRLALFFPRKAWICIGEMFGISVQRVSSIGPEYDKMWEKYRDYNDFLLVRDYDYLHHRFSLHPFAEYQFFEARRKGELCGYLVTRRRKTVDQHYCIVADWFYDSKHPLIFLSLLNTALQHSIKCDIERCSAWVIKSRRDKWLFALSGFILRGKVPIIFHTNDIGKQILGKRQKCHFVIADSDNV
ncbi:MAG: GNAT family N-acetyltransferase [Planctomycetes bacterium]|nr:GNAT family N-acetyltransferase [Planctomycetota bacterium]